MYWSDTFLQDYDPAKDSEDMYRDAAAVEDKSTGMKTKL